MKKIVPIALRTEFSFKKTYGSVSKLPEMAVDGCVGIADINNTFGHFELEKVCTPKNIKPLLGVRLPVWPHLDRSKEYIGPEYIFIAKNQSGLEEIYLMIQSAYENFYYAPRLLVDEVRNLSGDVIVIAENFFETERLDYIALTPTTPRVISEIEEIPKVYLSNNFFTDAEDREVYQLMAGARKDGRSGGYNHLFESQTYPQHILSAEEHYAYWHNESAIDNTYEIAASVESFKLHSAPMVEYRGARDLKDWCMKGATKLGVNLMDEEYAERLDYELELIEQKNYGDYFLIVADMIDKAKKKMLVGPARGSSAGSLVCYLIGITTIDPLKFGLLFERFIDLNRLDLPDIDIDFPDKHRDKVIKQLVKDYGRDNVRHIANVNRLKARSAIGEFAQALGIPAYETDEIKDAIVERSGGDARAQFTMMDTFEHTEVGKNFIRAHPKMKLAEKIENHANHTGMHAAGIIVSSEPIIKYAGINTRDDVIMLDKKGAEAYNLLKIDCLGLRTLTVLQECAKLAGFPMDKYFTLELEDPEVYKLFKEMRLSGVFQFEGYALASITRDMPANHFNDIVATTALARPGPLHSGGTNTYIRRRTGKEKVKYISEHPTYVQSTKETYGIIIYQEQLMTIAREVGGMSWEEVSELRKAASKSLGEEFFNKYKESFIKGTDEKGIDRKEAEDIWSNMVTFGSWGFNKSHAVAYSLISYWTAWAKTYHPVEFAVANLNNARDDDSALKLLRDMVSNDGLEYVAFDPDHSQADWTVHGGKILGGLTTVKGIGVSKARDIIKKRAAGGGYTESLVMKLMNPNSIFNILFPCDHYWGDYYRNPINYGLGAPPSMINQSVEVGSYIVIGKLTMKNLRDLNELASVVKRGGEIIEEDALFLNIALEDDTDRLICQIDRFKFEEMGRDVLENGRIDFDWYIVKGEIKHRERRLLKIEAIHCLTTDWVQKK
jgi:DNA polymerase III alpha subunit